MKTTNTYALVTALLLPIALPSGCSEEPHPSHAGMTDPAAMAMDKPAEAATSPSAVMDAGARRPPIDTAGLLGLDASAFPYIYFEREKVLLDGIDFEATLKIAEAELEKGGSTSVLTLWTIRDQQLPAWAAARVGDLYLRYIDGEGLSRVQTARGITFGHDFAVWHFAWAVGNIYRLGPPDVRSAIQSAFDDALKRPGTLNAPYDVILEEHLMGEQIYMGDAHDGGRSYARSHIVIPGNADYLQSFDDYPR